MTISFSRRIDCALFLHLLQVLPLHLRYADEFNTTGASTQSIRSLFAVIFSAEVKRHSLLDVRHLVCDHETLKETAFLHCLNHFLNVGCPVAVAESTAGGMRHYARLEIKFSKVGKVVAELLPEHQKCVRLQLLNNL